MSTITAPTLVNGSFENWTGDTPDNWTETESEPTSSADWNIYEDAVKVKAGSSSVRFHAKNANSGGGSLHLTLTSDAISVSGSQNVILGYWVYPDTRDGGTGTIKVKIKNNDSGETEDDISALTLDAWHWRDINHTTGAGTATITIEIKFTVTAFNNIDWDYYFDQFVFADSSASLLMANFNGEKYLADGNILYKLASGRASYSYVSVLPADITALVPSLDSKLYIFMGDSEEYMYMTTAEAFAQTDVADAYYGWQYDNKLFKCNSTGTVTYCANPDTASPSWVAAGTITDIADQIERFIVARDAAGSTVSYAATNSILKVLDLDTPEWLDTEVRLPNHPNGGKGACYFNGRIYLSYGLGVLEYNPNTGYVRDIGLTERDGLPIDFNGEIVYLLGDSSEKKIFALVDSSITSGDSYSGLYSWSEDTGWQCWWYDDTVNQAMSEAIVSPAESSYAIYWGVGSKVYYIDIPRGIKNPDKISQNYATSGVFITPWFDADNGVALKLAKSLQSVFTGITDKETVTLKYRIDHENTDLDTGWTNLDSLAYYKDDDFEWGSDGDDITTSGGNITWSKTVVGSGTAKITTDDKHAGTRSLELYGNTTNPVTAYFTQTAENGYDISYWVKGEFGIYHSFRYNSATKRIRYYTPYGDTDWHHIEFKNIDFNAGTYDRYVDDVLSNRTMETGSYLENTIEFQNSDVGGSLALIYIDDIEITKTDFNEAIFNSGAGIAFRAIQFRLDFGTSGATAHPDAKSLVLYFKKETGSSNIWAWDINIKIEEDSQYTAKQKYEFLESAKESDTDILFSYHPNDNSSEQFYVQISSFEGTSETGRDYRGRYSLRLIES